MATIIQDNAPRKRQPSLGEILGQSVAQGVAGGIGRGVGGVVEKGIGSIFSGGGPSGFTPEQWSQRIPDMSPEDAQTAAQFPVNIQAQMWQEAGKAAERRQSAEEKRTAPAQKRMELAQAISQMNKKPVEENFKELQNLPDKMLDEIAKNMGVVGPDLQTEELPIPQQEAATTQEQQLQSPEEPGLNNPEMEQALEADEPESIDDLIKKEVAQLKKEEQAFRPHTVTQLVKDQGLTAKQAQEELKQSQDYMKELRSRKKTYREEDRILREMETLVDRAIKDPSVLRSPGTQKLIENAKLIGSGLGSILGTLAGSLGGPIGSVTGGAIGGGALGGAAGTVAESLAATNITPETQAFQKLRDSLRQFVMASIKGKPAEATIEGLMGEFPSLLQTNEGKKAALELLKKNHDALYAEVEIADKVIKANNGRVPANLQQIVEKIADQVREYVADDVEDIVENGIPSQPNDRTIQALDQQAQSLVI